MSSRQHSITLGLFIFSLAALFYGYEYILRVTPSVMNESLMTFFSLNATTFGTLSAVYFYAYTPMQLVVGIIVDRYNIRIVLSISILCCALGCIIMGAAPSIWMAATGRFLQGLGSAFAFVSALKIASIWLPANRFALCTGINNSVGFLFAGLLGEVVLNEFLQVASWHMAFYLLGIIGVVLAITLWFLMHNETNLPQSTTSTKTFSLKENISNLQRIMKIPGIWTAGLIASLLFLPTSVFASLWGIPYLEALHHYSKGDAALANSMIFVGWAIGSFGVGYLSDRLGKRAVLIRIGSLSAFFLACILLYVSRLDFTVVCGLFILFGIASSVEILTFVLARDYSPYQHAVGTAIAFVNMLSMLGGMIFQGGLGKLMDLHVTGKVHHGIHYYSLNDYQYAIVIIPISLLLAFILSLTIQDHP